MLFLNFIREEALKETDYVGIELALEYLIITDRNDKEEVYTQEPSVKSLELNTGAHEVSWQDKRFVIQNEFPFDFQNFILVRASHPAIRVSKYQSILTTELVYLFACSMARRYRRSSIRMIS